MTTVPPDPFEQLAENPSGFMAYHQSIGSSARTAVAEFRAIGGSMGDARFRALYSQVGDTLARTPDFLALEPGALPSPSDYGTWAAGGGGKYAMQVLVHQIDQETGIMVQGYYTVMSDSPFSKQDAEAQAMSDFGADDAEEAYGLTVIGAYAVHVWQTVPWNR